MKKLKSATLDNEAISVDVEITFNNGLPALSIVGLASSVISESRDRVKSALLNNKFEFPAQKITINLSPSDISKTGSHFDLPIALLIYTYKHNINFNDFYFFGELGLDGSLKDTNSIFALVLSLAKQGKKNFLVPFDSIDKLQKIPNINIYGVKNLLEAIDFFKNQNKYKVSHETFNYNYIEIRDKKYFYLDNFELDFKDIKGQQFAKRASLISASGFHNILFNGTQGSGKSMISKRLRYILPPMSIDEILEKARIESFDNNISFKPLRSFRSPHHSSTKGAIFGGGSKNSKIGEVALANKGILFFDEIVHFSKNILEALREPLEDKYITISRVNSKITYESDFLFVGAMNPCPCGNLLSKTRDCRCTDIEIKRYQNKLSEPFLDRIDLYVEMDEVSINDKADISSKDMFKKVLIAFKNQIIRQNKLNGNLSEQEIKKFCILDNEANSILEKASKNFNLSFRAINKVLKVARTIADIDSIDKINKKHIIEALSYRKR